MKRFSMLALLTGLLLLNACAQQRSAETPEQQLTGLPKVITDPSRYNELTEKEKYVILEKGTEWAFSGAFHSNKEKGIYICKQCNNPLFRSEDKFDSRSGWPSFDDMIAGAVKEIPDADGMRTEIVCANCSGHLGHVFRGEGFTDKQTRHCVNSVSLDFVPALFTETPPKNTDVRPIYVYVKGKGLENYDRAVFAGGCFWCVEAAFERIEGVAEAISGYSGGEEAYPTYEEVCAKQTGHAESVVVYFDPAIVTYQTLLEVFFTAHDPTQFNRQGPDVGPQYRSAIFYRNEEQKVQAEAYIKKLNSSGEYTTPIVTELSAYNQFWVAEGYHQNYYEAHPENPYVQRISRPKVEKVEKKFKNILKKAYQP